MWPTFRFSRRVVLGYLYCTFTMASIGTFRTSSENDAKDVVPYMVMSGSSHSLTLSSNALLSRQHKGLPDPPLALPNPPNIRGNFPHRHPEGLLCHTRQSHASRTPSPGKRWLRNGTRGRGIRRNAKAKGPRKNDRKARPLLTYLIPPLHPQQQTNQMQRCAVGMPWGDLVLPRGRSEMHVKFEGSYLKNDWKYSYSNIMSRTLF